MSAPQPLHLPPTSTNESSNRTRRQRRQLHRRRRQRLGRRRLLGLPITTPSGPRPLSLRGRSPPPRPPLPLCRLPPPPALGAPGLLPRWDGTKKGQRRGSDRGERFRSVYQPTHTVPGTHPHTSSSARRRARASSRSWICWASSGNTPWSTATCAARRRAARCVALRREG